MKHVVAHVNEIRPGTAKAFALEGSDVLVCNVDGSFYAIEDVCTHDGGALDQGKQLPVAQPALGLDERRAVRPLPRGPLGQRTHRQVGDVPEPPILLAQPPGDGARGDIRRRQAWP